MGDIHGVFEVLERIERLVDLSRNRVFLLGDYVDRGKEGYKVLEYLMKKNIFDSEQPGIHCLLGNHDINLLNCIMDYKLKPTDFIETTLCKILGIENKHSFYKIDLLEVVNFLFGLPVLYKIILNNVNYFLVHAALPYNNYEEIINTKLSDISCEYSDLLDYMLWEREKFLFSTNVFNSVSSAFNSNNIVCFGHTPINKIKNWKLNGYENLLPDGNRIEIFENTELIRPVIHKNYGYINIDTFSVCNFLHPNIYKSLSYTLLRLDDLTYNVIQK